LAHRTGNATELAYMRSDQLEKRRRLMADWAAFCETPVTSGGDPDPRVIFPKITARKRLC
jgi:hypothetical protein